MSPQRTKQYCPQIEYIYIYIYITITAVWALCCAFEHCMQRIVCLVSDRNLLYKIQVLRCIVVFVLQNMCEACMLKSTVQALIWVVEIATQEM